MRIFTGVAIAVLSVGLIAGGCGGKQNASSKSGTKQSASSKGGSKSSAKSSRKAASGKKKGGSTAAAPPTTGTTTQSGNPTGSNAQAAALYQQKCQVCHGAGGKGASAPKLDAGLTTRFQTQAALQSFIQKNMPFNSPGSLTQAQAGALARYLWSMQKP